MASGLSRISKSPVFRIAAAQFIATLLVSALSLVLGRAAAVSALLAGAVCILPVLFVLVMSLRSVDPGSSGLALVIKGEAGKMAMTVALFAVVFVWVKPLDVAVFFGTVIILQLCTIAVPVMAARKLLRPRPGR